MRVLFFSSYHAVPMSIKYRVGGSRRSSERAKLLTFPFCLPLLPRTLPGKLALTLTPPPPPKIWVGSFRLHLRPAASTAACTAPNAAVVHGRRREASSPSSPVTPPLPLSALNLVRGIARRPPSSPLVAFPPLSARRRPDIPSRGRLRRLLF